MFSHRSINFWIFPLPFCPSTGGKKISSHNIFRSFYQAFYQTLNVNRGIAHEP